MTDIWYLVSRYHSRIETIAVEKSTDKSIFIVDKNGKQRRASRSSKYYENYFSTWQEAHDFLLERAERYLASSHAQLQRAQREYGNVKGLKEPTP